MYSVVRWIETSRYLAYKIFVTSTLKANLHDKGQSKLLGANPVASTLHNVLQVSEEFAFDVIILLEVHVAFRCDVARYNRT